MTRRLKKLFLSRAASAPDYLLVFVFCCFQFSHAALLRLPLERSLSFAFGLFFSSPHNPNSELKAFSNSNYQHIFFVALESYKKRSGNDLSSNPLFPRLEILRML
jgi:hypothetical protein